MRCSTGAGPSTTSWSRRWRAAGGIATALAGAAIEALERKGAPRVVLHTAAANEPAQRFFEKLGFRRTMIEMTREAAVTSPSARSRS